MKKGNRYSPLFFSRGSFSFASRPVFSKTNKNILTLIGTGLFFSLVSVLQAQNCSISVDAVNSTTSGSQNISIPITVAGSNRLLVVEIDVLANDGASDISSVNFGSAPMSQVIKTTRAGAGGGRQAIFVLVAPTLGSANSVNVDLNGNKNSNIGVIDYNGVDQNNPIGAITNTFNSSASSQAVTLSTQSTTSTVLANFLWYSNTSLLLLLGTGQTQRWTKAQNDSAEGDDVLTGGAAAVTMTYTLSSAALADIQAMEIKPCSLPTNTPTATSTATSTSTYTSTPRSTATSTATSTVTLTHTVTMTPTITLTPTITPTPTATTNPYPVYSAWPNPFTPDQPTNNTAFFNMPSNHGPGEVLILDLRQRPIRHFTFDPGVVVGWDGRDNAGQMVHGGLYVFMLKVDGRMTKRSVTVLR